MHSEVWLLSKLQTLAEKVMLQQMLEIWIFSTFKGYREYSSLRNPGILYIINQRPTAGVHPPCLDCILLSNHSAAFPLSPRTPSSSHHWITYQIEVSKTLPIRKHCCGQVSHYIDSMGTRKCSQPCLSTNHLALAVFRETLNPGPLCDLTGTEQLAKVVLCGDKNRKLLL